MPAARILTAITEINALETEVREAADASQRALEHLVRESPDGLSLLQQLKFHPVGRHPVERRELNLVEQLNQTFTTLVSLRAARWLLEHHVDAGGVQLALGAEAGLDLQSVTPNIFAAEAFAATRPQSTQKLSKDVARLTRLAPQFQYRYVFFHSPNVAAGRCQALERVGLDVQIWSVAL